MKQVLILAYLLYTTTIFSQALPISLDESYEDWQNSNYTYTDNQGDGNTNDFIECSVANDQDYLYIRLKFSSETDLTENNSMGLLIDGDNNSATGSFTQGIGVDLRINFGNRDATVFTPNFNNIDLEDVKFRVAPTVTSDVFEMAIDRNYLFQGNAIFQGDTIRLAFKDYNGAGDALPDAGSTFFYVFENTTIPAPSSIDFSSNSTNGLRLMTYNTEFDGLTDNNRRFSFERIISAANPDIITFNETWNTSLSAIQNFMDNVLPQTNGWYGYKNNGNATLSKYPIIQTWDVHTNRVHAVLVDVSASNFQKDSLLIVNAHLKCCDGDNLRQEQSDAFASFILDAKTAGGQIDLSPNTPFALMGDLNLVGFSQQLTTLLTGQIINTFPYGSSGALDWDNSDLTDQKPRQTDSRMTYTWRNDNSSFPPGRLDFMIYSDAVMQVDKSFVVRTDIMSSTALSQYGLLQNDSETASDHYPIVSDISTIITSSKQQNSWQPSVTIAPNPISENISLIINLEASTVVFPQLYDNNGQLIQSFSKQDLTKGEHQITLQVANLPVGVYQLVLRSELGTISKSIIKH